MNKTEKKLKMHINYVEDELHRLIYENQVLRSAIDTLIPGARYIHMSGKDNQYYFEDETNDYSGNGPYDSFQEAHTALKDYCKHVLEQEKKKCLTIQK